MRQTVFAYGSNMCSGRFRDYGVCPEGVGRPAVLSGHRLIFNKKSTKDNSGKANVEAGDSEVWGVLYTLSDADLRQLDEGEVGYRRIPCVVRSPDGTNVDAWTYVALTSDLDPALRPYGWYKRFLVEGAKEHSLPADYVASLELIEATADPNSTRDAARRSLECASTVSLEGLSGYLGRLREETTLEFYIPRRFRAATAEGGAEPDVGFQLRGVYREGEPQLAEILKHPRTVVLGEPGAGKSLVTRAAVVELLSYGNRVPIVGELKAYRGDLLGLLRSDTPPSILDVAGNAGSKKLERAYVLDGVDEIPFELIEQFGKDLARLLERDSNAAVLLTARQAFYVTHRALLPQFPAVFHVLDFSDEDIREFLERRGIAPTSFLEAVSHADADEEIRNPFVLNVMSDLYAQNGHLSKLRSQNISFIIDRLIHTRTTLVDPQRQRRALSMLGIACETYCRNELTEDEALRVIQQSMRITEQGSRQMLDELHASILRRTINGFAFQMRSYGEYLAAEELFSVHIDRLQELAFLSRDTPNESWTNAISYLAELNAEVREYFVRKYPFWMLNSSPAAFSETEKDTLVRSVFEVATGDDQYIYRHPRVVLFRLARFLTTSMEDELRPNLSSPNKVARGNALVLLSLRGSAAVLPEALAILKDRTLDLGFRQCGILAVLRAGSSALVPELLSGLDRADPLYNEILDAIGSLSDESQMSLVLPLLLETGSILSSAFYHFREFRSREAVLAMLDYFVARPNDLNVIRVDGYLEPLLKLIAKYWDATIIERCAALIHVIDEQRIYPDSSGIAYKLFRAIREADTRGLVTQHFLDSLLRQGVMEEKRWFYADQLLADSMTTETGQWLIDHHATELIKQFSPFIHGPVRDLLRPHSEGLIDLQEDKAKAYAAERSEKENARNQQLALLQEQIANGRDFVKTLNSFSQLPESHWPELKIDHKTWLALEVSSFLLKLDLEHAIRWEGDALSVPVALPLVLKVIRRYELTIDPDTPLIYATGSLDENLVADYAVRAGLSTAAKSLVETMLNQPRSPRAHAGLIGFTRSSKLWSDSIRDALIKTVLDPKPAHCQIDALRLATEHGLDDAFLVKVAADGASKDLRETAFRILVERGHRPTIERALSLLIGDEYALRAGESDLPYDSTLGWITKIRSDFAIHKLAEIRGKTLDFRLPRVCSIVTETLARINRTEAARIVRRQIPRAVPEWKHAQVLVANEQDRTAKIEAIQNTPFESILAKLKGATSMQLLKVWCEGPTDVPVLKTLLEQIPDVPKVLFDFVGGWANLVNKDPHSFEHGCKESFIVMDGDLGRRFDRKDRPLTKLAREQERRLAACPVELHVLKRYGIENYFPKAILEAVIGRDLTPFFPIPDHVAVTEYLKDSNGLTWWQAIQRFLVFRLHLRIKLSGTSLYSKSANEKVAQCLVLDRDMLGTDLGVIISRIAERAKSLADS
jgi:hypothetical protein